MFSKELPDRWNRQVFRNGVLEELLLESSSSSFWTTGLNVIIRLLVFKDTTELCGGGRELGKLKCHNTHYSYPGSASPHSSPHLGKCFLDCCMSQVNSQSSVKVYLNRFYYVFIDFIVMNIFSGFLLCLSC